MPYLSKGSLTNDLGTLFMNSRINIIKTTDDYTNISVFNLTHMQCGITSNGLVELK